MLLYFEKSPELSSLLISDFNKVMNRIIARINEKISANGNDSHTTSTLWKIFESIYAIGNRKISCLVKEIKSALIPLPVAWKNEINNIPNEAGIKHRLIILKAGTPVAISEASPLNRLSRTSGISQNSAVPTSIIKKAIHIPHFKADKSRFLFFAP